MQHWTSGSLTVHLVRSARELKEHIAICREMPEDVAGDVDPAGAAPPTRRFFTAYLGDQPVGVACVDLQNREIALRDRSCLGLPFGRSYIDAALAQLRVAQMGYLAVHPRARGGLVGQKLLDASVVEVIAHGAFRFFRQVDLGTDVEEDALRAMRQIEALGYFDRALFLPERKDGVSRAGCLGRHPLYSVEERQRVDAGQFQRVPLPHSVTQICSYEAVFVGPPRLDTAGKYTAPVVVRIPEPSLLGHTASPPGRRTPAMN